MNVTAFPPKGAGLESLITEKKTCWERLKAENAPSSSMAWEMVQ